MPHSPAKGMRAQLRLSGTGISFSEQYARIIFSIVSRSFSNIMMLQSRGLYTKKRERVRLPQCNWRYVVYFFFPFSSVARLCINRPLRREALLLWSTPFCAALSSALTAISVAVRASSTLPASIAVRAFLTKLRARPRYTRLRKRRFSFCRIRFFADCRFAKIVTPINWFVLRRMILLYRNPFVK